MIVVFEYLRINNEQDVKMKKLGFAMMILSACLYQADAVTVSPDGKGDYKTIQEAINAAPDFNETPFVINVRPGTYKEVVRIPKNKSFVTLLGESAEKTIITFDNTAPKIAPDGKPFGTFRSATAFIDGSNFTADKITFENSAFRTGQALAVSISGDRAVFRRCRFIGWQDTVFTAGGREYFEDCYIDGACDFIFGGATAWFERCRIHCKGGGYITAASTDQKQPFGYVFSNCMISAELGVRFDLGRPWMAYASVIFLNTVMPPEVSGAGWNNWGNVENEKTARFAEYGSKTEKGQSLDVSKRVPWSKQLTEEEARQITVDKALGGTDKWNPVSAESALQAKQAVPAAASIILRAKDVAIKGKNARLENEGANIGFWTDTDTSFECQADVQPGTYLVKLHYALDAGQAGSEIQIKAGDSVLKLVPPATGGWQDVRSASFGEIEIKKEGKVSLCVSAISKKKDFILNLAAVTLIQKK
ncbi:MAG: hypothetical protein A2X45_25135 [Lentisphaerae bacterium GWF2_50_93]|nr:MAG: hypothetical protein A2X45_25135 [Lentisphaerae bacterium GWF2_50_93]